MTVKRENKPNPRFDAIDSVLYDLRMQMVQKIIQSTDLSAIDLGCLKQKCERIEFVRSELLLMKNWRL